MDNRTIDKWEFKTLMAINTVNNEPLEKFERRTDLDRQVSTVIGLLGGVVQASRIFAEFRSRKFDWPFNHS